MTTPKSQKLNTCPICLDKKTKDQLCIAEGGCGHSVCWKCLGQAIKAHRPLNKCPLCRGQFHIGNVSPMEVAPSSRLGVRGGMSGYATIIDASLPPRGQEGINALDISEINDYNREMYGQMAETHYEVSELINRTITETLDMMALSLTEEDGEWVCDEELLAELELMN